MKWNDWQDLDGANGDGYFDRHGAKDFKRYRPVPWFWIIIAMIAVLYTCAAKAQVTTYAYQGQPYDATGDAISGFIELAHPLEPNAVTVVTPSVQSFMTAVGAAALSDPSSAFTLTTDANGNIIAWSFSGFLDFSCYCTIVFSSSDTAYDNVTENKQGNPFDPTPPQSFGTSIKAGAWTTIAGAPMMAMSAQVASMTTQETSMQSQINTLTTEANSYAKGYIAANAIITELNAALVSTKGTLAWWTARGWTLSGQLTSAQTQIKALEAQVALCRVKHGVC